MTIPRKVHGLLWAEQCSNPLRSCPKSKMSASQRAGLRYEDAIKKCLPGAQGDLWFRYCDSNGEGYCAPDIVLELRPNFSLILECKLTDKLVGQTQISQLYIPVLSKVWPQKKFLGFVVAKNLSPRSNVELLARTLAEAVKLAEKGHVPVLHCPRPDLAHITKVLALPPT